MAKPVIAIDFDHTIRDNKVDAPMDGVREALDRFRERGWKILIHSANKKAFIEQWCEEHNIPYHWIWDQPGKPEFVTCFVDDRAIQFRGDWEQTTADVLAFVEARPIRH